MATDLHYTFMRKVLSDSCIPDSHTLIPPQLTEERRKLKNKDFPSKSNLSTRLFYNEPIVSESLAEFCTAYNIKETLSTSEDDSISVDFHSYFLSICPTINYTDTLNITSITVNGDTYTFDGFNLISQQKLQHVTPLYIQQYGYNYTVTLEPANDTIPKFTTIDALLLEEYLFNDVIELFDMTHVLKFLNCKIFFVPRFRSHPEMKLLSLRCVLQWIIDTREPLSSCLKISDRRAASQMSDGWIVTNPHVRPSSIRIDRLQWPQSEDNKGPPHIVHFSSMFNESIDPTGSDHEVYRPSTREVMLSLPSDNFLLTGIYTDVIQHALLLPLLLGHILYHNSLCQLEEKLEYYFKDRQVLERALTLPSYCPLNGLLGKQVKIISSNCGLRRAQVNTSIRSTQSRRIKAAIQHAESQSESERLRHNEQLEFLGDAVLEYICSLHLYHMFPDEKLGQLASYRTLLVKNKHLALLAHRLDLQKYILTTKNNELPSASKDTAAVPATMDVIAHTNANTLEAIIGAVFIDTGLSVTQDLIARFFFPEDVLRRVWIDYPPDLLQTEHPDGDRHLIPSSPILKKLVELEKSTGVEFKHIRLLAKAFTHSSVPLSRLVGGSYEKLEHLGDAVLQFLASNYIYRKFPTLHEGHYSLLRTILVQNKQLAELCQQLGFDQYIRKEATMTVGVKMLADVVESYLAALMLDKGLDYCQTFLEVCLFPKLLEIVKNCDIEDANTQLQKATARLCRQLHMEQEIPTYRQLKSTNTPQFTIGVYFKNQRLATGVGYSLRDARRIAAEKALESDVLKKNWWK